MMILGIRTSPTTVRYAVLDCNGASVSLVNADSENKLDFPADCRSIEQKLHWLHQELDWVLRQYPGIERIVIKANEYGRGGEKASSREALQDDRNSPQRGQNVRGDQRQGDKPLLERADGRCRLCRVVREE